MTSAGSMIVVVIDDENVDGDDSRKQQKQPQSPFRRHPSAILASSRRERGRSLEEIVVDDVGDEEEEEEKEDGIDSIPNNDGGGATATTTTAPDDDVAVVVPDDDDNAQRQPRPRRCTLCEGLAVDASGRFPFPEMFPNATCSMIAGFVPPDDPELTCRRGDPMTRSAFEKCCRPSIPVYDCETNVHEKLFGASSSSSSSRLYNPSVPPIPSLEPDEGLEVYVEIHFQTVREIDEEKGTAKVGVTLILTWLDPRLKWDLDDPSGTCANTITVHASQEDGSSPIWVPDFDLTNQIDGIQAMRASRAEVFADGFVLWEHAGEIEAVCAFKGLAEIPFDELGCQLFFVPFTRQGADALRYRLFSPDALTFGFFDQRYNEWRPIPELFEQGYNSGNPDFIYYNMYFQRSKKHYVSTIVIPTSIMTYLSFLTFLMDVRTGERMGFSVALALVVVAQQIITSEILPVSNQSLWLMFFVQYSFYWVLFVVIESIAIGFMYYVRVDHYRQKKQSEKDGEDEEQEELRRLVAYANNHEDGDGDEDRAGVIGGWPEYDVMVAGGRSNFASAVVPGEKRTDDDDDDDDTKKETKNNREWLARSSLVTADEEEANRASSFAVHAIRRKKTDDDDDDDDDGTKNGARGDDDGKAGGCCGNNNNNGWLERLTWTTPFRRIDLTVMAVCFVTYTTFVIWMMVSQRGGSWLVNEPMWLDEETPPLDQLFTFVFADDETTTTDGGGGGG